MAKQVVWVYAPTRGPAACQDPLPTRAVRLRNGDTLISDQFNNQVILVTHAKKIVWHARPDRRGRQRPGLLNGPYDAKVIGDYTGLTRP